MTYPVRSEEIATRVGHPGDMWDALKDRVQDEGVRSFASIQGEWLDIMWALDSFRRYGVAPDRMGDSSGSESKRLAAVYRMKGNWFATLVALLLENQTSHRLAPRMMVQGFSQTHQIDIAWPARELDPLICLETKVTGAPSTPSDPERGAMADWTNRRKELKFAATDLKLSRRQHLTEIGHWDVWREQSSPRCCFLWAARLKQGEDIGRLVQEVQALTKTYLDAAGVFAWQDGGNGYIPVPLPPLDRVSTIDDVLYRIASELRQLAPPGQDPPAPEVPRTRTLDATRLSEE